MGFVTINGKLTHGRRGNEIAARGSSKPAGVAAIATVPADPCPGRFFGRCVAVTSLSPNPSRASRQRHCLQSWHAIGLPILAVQTEEEIRSLESVFDLPQWIACEDATTAYDQRTQKVSNLIRAGAATGLPFLLVNSDIEIRNHPAAIAAAISRPGNLVIGVRYNHDPRQPLSNAIREPWGLDCFVMTPEMAETVPDLPFGIGKPCWDYWLPHHFRERGNAISWMAEPLLFHERHPLGWTPDDWQRGAGWLAHRYGLILGKKRSEAFRRSFDRKGTS